MQNFIEALCVSQETKFWHIQLKVFTVSIFRSNLDVLKVMFNLNKKFLTKLINTAPSHFSPAGRKMNWQRSWLRFHSTIWKSRKNPFWSARPRWTGVVSFLAKTPADERRGFEDSMTHSDPLRIMLLCNSLKRFSVLGIVADQ